MIPGNDSTIKRYLATMVKTLKDQLASLKDQSNNLQYRLEIRLQDTLSALEKSHVDNDRQKVEFNEALRKIKEESMAEYMEFRSHATGEKEDLIHRHESDLKRSQERVGNLELQNRLLTEAKFQLEEAMQELTGKCRQMEQELQSATDELEELRKSRKELESIQFKYERELSDYRIQTTVFDRQLHEKEEHLQRTSDSLIAIQEQKKKIEEALELYKTQNNRLEEALKKGKDEITKGNEIIQKLQMDLRDARTKVKLKNVIVSQQERLVEDRQRMIDTLNREVQELKDQNGLKDQEIERLNTQLKLSIRKLDEGKQIIETNENGKIM